MSTRGKHTKKRQKWGVPWFREWDGWWYVTIHGQRVKLAKGEANKAEALKRWHEVMAVGAARDKGAENTIVVLADLYLDFIEREHPASYAAHRRYLKSFITRWPHLTVASLTAKHVTAWLDSNPTWGQSSQNSAIRKIVACLNWAARPEQSYIDRNPIAKIRKPACRARGAEALIAPEDFAALLEASNERMRDVLLFLRQTGTRPGNLARIEAKTVRWEARCVRLERHKTGEKTGRPLIIPLTKPALEILRRLAKKHPDGPLFCTRSGKPWTSKHLAEQFRRLRERLRKDGKVKGSPFAYSLRHQLATDLLSAGVPDAHVAATLGHTSTIILHRNYSHITGGAKEYAAAIERVINQGGEADG
jgi:integrase